jgi:hypothetical protein
MKPKQLIAAALLLGLAGLVRADVTPTGAAVGASPSGAAAAVSPAADASVDLDGVLVMKEVRVTAKRGEAERRALSAAAQQALDEARLRHWQLNNITVRDLVQSVIREESLGAFELGKARIESVTQERADGPDGKEAWKCRLVLSFRRK